MTPAFLYSRLHGTFLFAAVCLFGPAPTAPAGEPPAQGSSTVSFTWHTVPDYLVGLGHDIVNHGKRVIESDDSHQYQEPRARYYDQQNYRHSSMEAAVQQALARNGYYNGPIDGNIGPMSRRSIANYQSDRGMRVTGYPNASLLASLGLQ